MRTYWTTNLCLALALLGLGGILYALRPQSESLPSHLRPVRLIPATTVLAARTSGTLRAIHVRPGDAVTVGQLLLNIEVPQLPLAQSARDLSEIAGGIPRGAAAPLIDQHPSVLAAEQAYVDALAAFDKSQTPATQANIQSAARRRVETRQSISRTLNGAPAQSTTLTSLVQALRDQAEVRAPVNARVDLLRHRIGDSIAAGQPVAILVHPQEYFAEMTLPAGYPVARLAVGTSLPVQLANTNHLTARVDSLFTRQVPFSFRRERHQPSEQLVRLRVHSPAPVDSNQTAFVTLPELP